MIFKSTNMLLPQTIEMKKWAVIACDQFTSQPEYWQRVKSFVGENPSTFHMIYPEAELSSFSRKRIMEINQKMNQYKSILTEYPDSYIYVERTLLDGRIRRGVIGVIDLEAYDYSNDSTSLIRATEQTVIERIPPRLEVRKRACLELSHVLLLCDDEKKQLIEKVSEQKKTLALLYDFDLMECGGHVKGWLLQGKEAEKFSVRLNDYMAGKREKCLTEGISPLYFAVGDGNHSLATAKANYEQIKLENGGSKSEELARYALVELENIHDESLVFEPIHRLVKTKDVNHLLKKLQIDLCMHNENPCESDSRKIEWYTENENGTFILNSKESSLSVEILQDFLDKYLKTYGGEIDYIHGESSLKNLICGKEMIGFVVPTIKKSDLFMVVAQEGALPRKTFSMGHAEEKRYYIETRMIKED